MKTQVPDELKAAVPANSWGKILSTTPVVMAVVATLLAGLASSEMTRAQYDRSLAAQQQSKAGDQWSFYQAKKVRGAIQRDSADLLDNLALIHPLDRAAMHAAFDQAPGDVGAAKADMLTALESPAGRAAIDLLASGRVPDPEPAPSVDPDLAHALEAIGEQRPDDDVATAIERVADQTIAQALVAAKHRAQTFDEATKPGNAMVDRLAAWIARLDASVPDGGSPTATSATLKRDFAVSRFAYAARRYDTEARLNQDIAALYEVQVRRSNLSAERHHQRSQSFFFGMLGAQLGVIISTVALAAKRRNVLWSISAGAGLLAVGFAGYVYAFT